MAADKPPYVPDWAKPLAGPRPKTDPGPVQLSEKEAQRIAERLWRATSREPWDGVPGSASDPREDRRSVSRSRARRDLSNRNLAEILRIRDQVTRTPDKPIQKIKRQGPPDSAELIRQMKSGRHQQVTGREATGQAGRPGGPTSERMRGVAELSGKIRKKAAVKGVKISDSAAIGQAAKGSAPWKAQPMQIPRPRGAEIQTTTRLTHARNRASIRRGPPTNPPSFAPKLGSMVPLIGLRSQIEDMQGMARHLSKDRSMAGVKRLLKGASPLGYADLGT